jgi:hypothetical protein
MTNVGKYETMYTDIMTRNIKLIRVFVCDGDSGVFDWKLSPEIERVRVRSDTSVARVRVESGLCVICETNILALSIIDLLLFRIFMW